jgi:hypothetical protein
MTSQSPFQQFSAHESQSSPQSVHDPESVEPYELSGQVFTHSPTGSDVKKYVSTQSVQSYWVPPSQVAQVS